MGWPGWPNETNWILQVYGFFVTVALVMAVWSGLYLHRSMPTSTFTHHVAQLVYTWFNYALALALMPVYIPYRIASHIDRSVMNRLFNWIDSVLEYILTQWIDPALEYISAEWVIPAVLWFQECVKGMCNLLVWVKTHIIKTSVSRSLILMDPLIQVLRSMDTVIGQILSEIWARLSVIVFQVYLTMSWITMGNVVTRMRATLTGWLPGGGA